MSLINEKLNKTAILQHLVALNMHLVLEADDLHIFETIDSTNRFLKDYPSSNRRMVACCAETQTSGRGRLGREWISLPGENIYFSLRRPLPYHLPDLSSLGLVAGLATLAALKQLTPSIAPASIEEGIQLKWPNDIFWKNKKLGGILVELTGNSPLQRSVIIGIGLNLSIPTAGWLEPETMHQKPWGSLGEYTTERYCRNALIGELIYHLDKMLHRFEYNGFASFLPEWESVDYLQGKTVSVSLPTGQIHGIACGVNSQGQLLIKDTQGTLHALLSGEASLHLPL